MGLPEAFALTLTTALAKYMLEQWLGSGWQNQIGQDFLDLLRDSALNPTGASEAKHVDAIAARIYAQIGPMIENEWKHLTFEERESAVKETANTLLLVHIDAPLLITHRLDADRLFNYLLQSRHLVATSLSSEAL